MLPLGRPDHALVCFGRPHALVLELLDTLPSIGFRCEYVPLRIGRDTMHGVELSGLTSSVAEGADNLQRLAVENVDPLVGSVGNIQEPLLGIFREGYVPNRSVTQ